MKRWDIINSLIKKYKYKSYLEIGTQDPKSNFDKIVTLDKVSIDPFPRGEVTFTGTSDEYFESIKIKELKFDIIFIDGLHHYEQVLADISNSLKHLSKGGTIVCHDCLPTNSKMQERNDHGGEWTGDVWKAIAYLRMNTDDLHIQVVDTDYGCGILQEGTNIKFTPHINIKDLNYDFYRNNTTNLMNVISTKTFERWINGQ